MAHNGVVRAGVLNQTGRKKPPQLGQAARGARVRLAASSRVARRVRGEAELAQQGRRVCAALSIASTRVPAGARAGPVLSCASDVTHRPPGGGAPRPAARPSPKVARWTPPQRPQPSRACSTGAWVRRVHGQADRCSLDRRSARAVCICRARRTGSGHSKRAIHLGQLAK